MSALRLIKAIRESQVNHSGIGLFLLFIVGLAPVYGVLADEALTARTVKIGSGENVAFQLQAALIDAIPGDVIEIGPGKFAFDSEVNVVCDNVTIRGAGRDKTILSFKDQQVGGEGIFATGDAFVIEDLAIEDTAGNAIRVLGADGVTFRRVRAEWTGPPSPKNGAYGIYPVECHNVLIDECVSIGASDAGIYVGQSKKVVVKNCLATRNVAGIEIENTIHADVHHNRAIDNVGGLLVFDLPGLNVVNGGDVRVWQNEIRNNNHASFAPKGTIVSMVPTGTGLMVMATDHVEVFDNDIHDHETCNIVIASFLITERKLGKNGYDPYPESISIHDNRMSKGGYHPNGDIGKRLMPFVGKHFPDIFFDGFVDKKKFVDGKLPAKLGLHVANNGEATFANANVPDLTPAKLLTLRYQVDTKIEKLKDTPFETIQPVKLVAHAPPKKGASSGNEAVDIYRRAPRRLSEWSLFEDQDGTWKPASDVLVYRLNTPLFSDYAVKHRFIRLPEGQSMGWSDTDVLQFPVGTVIAKTFAYPDDATDSTAGERYIETRIEHHEPNGWFGYSYIWNDDQSDAKLSLGGGMVHVEWQDESGQSYSNDYRVPNAIQCLSCHSQNGKYEPIGPTARNLNGCGVDQEDQATANQLTEWIKAGKLATDVAESDRPRLACFDDRQSGSLDSRARAWLEVNCAHCHNPGGSARTSGLDLRECQSEPEKFGVWKSPVAAGKGTGGRSYDIVPGKPDQSILMHRLETDEAGARMPNLARSMIHAESNELIREWIRAMPSER